MLNAAILRRRRLGGNPLAAYAAGGINPATVLDFALDKYLGTVSALSDLTHAATSNGTVIDSDGVLKWRAHNLALNSATPATQNITVISGADYTVECTGSGSLTLSNAGSGTASAGSPVEITASSTTLTLTLVGSLDKMWVSRSDLGGMQANPLTGDSYVPTTTDAVYMPRFDYTHGERAILVERDASENVFHYSEDLTNAAWTKPNVTVTENAAVSPTGEMDAFKLEATATAFTEFRQDKTLSNEAVISYWFKQGSGPEDMAKIQLRNQTLGSTIVAATFNTVTKSFTYDTGSTGARYKEYANGWFRLSLTGAFSGSASIRGSFAAAGSVAAGKYSYVFGPQLEEGSVATSYLPTVGAASLSRAADGSIQIPVGNKPIIESDFGISVHGVHDYTDDGINTQTELVNWAADASNLARVYITTGASHTGTLVAQAVEGGTSQVAYGPTNSMSPGVGVEFNVSARFGADFVQVAEGGSAGEENTSPTAFFDGSEDYISIAHSGSPIWIYGVVIWSTDIAEIGLNTTSTPAWLIDRIGSYDAEINHLFTYGQSLSIGDLGYPIQSGSAAYDSIMFTRGMRPQYDYPLESNAQWYAGFVDAVEVISPENANIGETPSRGAADTIKELIASEDVQEMPDDTYTMLLSNPGYGALRIDQLAKGTDHFTRMVTQAQYGNSLATAEGKSYIVQAVSWIHGTSDYLNDTTKASYLASLNMLVSDIQTDIKAESGQTKRIAVIGAQTSNHFASTSNEPDIALAQLECHETNSNFFLACPTYHLPYNDVYHLNGPGYQWLGAYIGMVYKRVVIDGEDWEPVRPVSSAVAGANWDVTFEVRTGLALEWDTTTVAAQTDYGFTLVDSGDTPLTISSVTITGDNTVRVAAASTIPAGAKLRYAWQGDGDQGLGNLRDNQGNTITSIAASKPLHNWCVIFEAEN